jgi:hypothetical protein
MGFVGAVLQPCSPSPNMPQLKAGPNGDRPTSRRRWHRHTECFFERPKPRSQTNHQRRKREGGQEGALGVVEQSHPTHVHQRHTHPAREKHGAFRVAMVPSIPEKGCLGLVFAKIKTCGRPTCDNDVNGNGRIMLLSHLGHRVAFHVGPGG